MIKVRPTGDFTRYPEYKRKNVQCGVRGLVESESRDMLPEVGGTTVLPIVSEVPEARSELMRA